MKAIFIETTVFSAQLPNYLSDNGYRKLQQNLLSNPESGVVMPRTGGFRKMRLADPKRGKGRRGGLRIIYYWFSQHKQFWMFTIYNKDEMENLTSEQEKQLKNVIDDELKERSKS